jgi:hypothetical protein
MDTSLIHSYPQMIEACMAQLADVNEQLSDTREALRDAELEAMAAAIEARTEDNKPIYSNDKAREIATHRALKADEGYQRDRSTERILERRKVELEATAERLRREYRISLIEYEAQMLGHRAA